jgi:hypothetical protein
MNDLPHPRYWHVNGLRVSGVDGDTHRSLVWMRKCLARSDLREKDLLQRPNWQMYGLATSSSGRRE